MASFARTFRRRPCYLIPPPPTFGVCGGVYLPISIAHVATVDLNARKEAVMASVRNELALANAQELMNVRYVASFFPFDVSIRKINKHSHGCGVPPRFYHLSLRKQTTSATPSA